MKKLILSMVLVAGTAFSMMAQGQKCENQCGKQCAQTTQCAAQQPQCCDILFNGITLTPEQQAKFQTLKEAKAKKQAECKAKKQADMKEAKEHKQACRKQQLEEVKAILTPEQYVVYLENFYLSPMPAQKHGNMNANHGKMKAHGEKRQLKGNATRATKAESRSKK